MSNLTRLAPLLLLAAAATAQGHHTAALRPGIRMPNNRPAPAHTISTSTDFAVLANLGSAGDFDSVAAGTVLNRGLLVSAHTGAGRRGDSAHASSFVTFASRAGRGDGVHVVETGAVRNADPMQGASGGTSADAPGATSPTQAAHEISVNYPNIGMGNTAVVTIEWRGDASMGASASADVDIDGDGAADFSATANGMRASALLQVTAGASGVTIDITTNASVAVTAAGNERYHAALSVYVIEGALPTSCTFTSFGTACGATLTGTVGMNLDLSLAVTAAPASSFGFLLVGDKLATPMPLPIGTCSLLVDSMRSRHIGMPFRTDATGAATVSLRTPTTALTTSFQALLPSFNRMTTPVFSLDASNGTELVCQ